MNTHRLAATLALVCMAVSFGLAQKQGPRVFVIGNDAWESGDFLGGGGARPQTAEAIRTLAQRCPAVRLTNRKELADYVVVFEREGGKDSLSRKNKTTVFNRQGDYIDGVSTVILGNAMKDTCSAIVSDWNRTDRQADVAAYDVTVTMSRTAAHDTHSSSQIAFALLDAVVEHLESKGFKVTSDQDAETPHRLHLLVDRPLMKWVKVTVQALDSSGELLWQEVAESGGGLSGSHGLRVTRERLQKLLDKRLESGSFGAPRAASN
jgi:hypothetical protein